MRSRSTAARSPTPSLPTANASFPTRPRAWRAPAPSSWARATPPRGCGRSWTTREGRRRRDLGHRAWTPAELRFRRAFLERVDGNGGYREAAAPGLERIHFTGRLEHSDLPYLLPACEAQVVPSTWPEAFGMVAAEAASCGALPVSAAHSGLAEVSKILADALPQDLRPLPSFELADDAVEQITY